MKSIYDMKETEPNEEFREEATIHPLTRVINESSTKP